VAVALMVAEEEVLAMLRTVVVPILARYLDGRGLGVLIPIILNIVTRKPLKYFISSFHSANVHKLWQNMLQTTNKLHNFV
jgi:hypothetical protein